MTPPDPAPGGTPRRGRRPLLRRAVLLVVGTLVVALLPVAPPVAVRAPADLLSLVSAASAQEVQEVLVPCDFGYGVRQCAAALTSSDGGKDGVPPSAVGGDLVVNSGLETPSGPRVVVRSGVSPGSNVPYSPLRLVQGAQNRALLPMEERAKIAVAVAHGVPVDARLAGWARPEIQAWLLEDLHQVSYNLSLGGTADAEERAALERFEAVLKDFRVRIASTAVDFYDLWNADPCGWRSPTELGFPAYEKTGDVLAYCKTRRTGAPVAPPSPPTVAEFRAKAALLVYGTDVPGGFGGAEVDEVVLALQSVAPLMGSSIAAALGAAAGRAVPQLAPGLLKTLAPFSARQYYIPADATLKKISATQAASRGAQRALDFSKAARGVSLATRVAVASVVLTVLTAVLTVALEIYRAVEDDKVRQALESAKAQAARAPVRLHEVMALKNGAGVHEAAVALGMLTQPLDEQRRRQYAPVPPRGALSAADDAFVVDTHPADLGPTRGAPPRYTVTGARSQSVEHVDWTGQRRTARLDRGWFVVRGAAAADDTEELTLALRMQGPDNSRVRVVRHGVDQLVVTSIDETPQKGVLTPRQEFVAALSGTDTVGSPPFRFAVPYCQREAAVCTQAPRTYGRLGIDVDHPPVLQVLARRDPTRVFQGQPLALQTRVLDDGAGGTPRVDWYVEPELTYDAQGGKVAKPGDAACHVHATAATCPWQYFPGGDVVVTRTTPGTYRAYATAVTGTGQVARRQFVFTVVDQSFTLTAQRDVRPPLPADPRGGSPAPPDGVVVAGSTVRVSGTVLDNVGHGPLTYAVDWGDGTAGAPARTPGTSRGPSCYSACERDEDFSFEHTYTSATAPGPLQVTLTVKDRYKTETRTFALTYQHPAPVVRFAASRLDRVDEGDVLRVPGELELRGAGRVDLVVEWPGRSPSQPVEPAVVSWPCSGAECPFSEIPTSSATCGAGCTRLGFALERTTVQDTQRLDPDGVVPVRLLAFQSSAPGEGSVDVEVRNTDPTFRFDPCPPDACLPGSPARRAGSTVTVSGWIDDPGLEDDVLLRVDWDDGTAEEVVPFPPAARESSDPRGPRRFSVQRTYPQEEERFDIALQAQDDSGDALATAPVETLRKPPFATVVGVLDRAPDSGGTYTAPVTVDWQLQGAPAGTTPPPDTVVSTSGMQQRVVSAPVCNAGGECVSGSLVLSYDDTPPVLTLSRDREPGASGWYGAPVTVTVACEDAHAGVDACPEPVLVPEATRRQDVVVADRAGNTATATVDLPVDQTPPTVALTATPEDALVDETGEVAPSCSSTDALSGPAGCTVERTVVASANGPWDDVEVVARALDEAGNSATTRRSYRRAEDLTGPVITAVPDRDPDRGTLYTSPVTVRFTCEDPSTVAQCPDPVVFDDDGRAQQRTVFATDGLANESARLLEVSVDSTPPLLALNEGVLRAKDVVDVDCLAQDDTTSVVTLACPRQQLDGAELAPGEVVLIATAVDEAGNTATRSGRYAATLSAMDLPPVTSRYAQGRGDSTRLQQLAFDGDYARYRAEVEQACCVDGDGPRAGALFTRRQADTLLRLARLLESGQSPSGDGSAGVPGGSGEGQGGTDPSPTPPAESRVPVVLTAPPEVARSGGTYAVTGEGAPGAAYTAVVQVQGRPEQRSRVVADDAGRLSFRVPASGDAAHALLDAAGRTVASASTRVVGTWLRTADTAVPVGTRVTLHGLARPGERVDVLFRRRGQTAFTDRRDLVADPDGTWSTTFVAGEDHRFFARSGEGASRTGLVQASSVTLSGPARAVRGSTVVLTGVVRPLVRVQVLFRRAGTSGFVVRRDVVPGRDGRWRTSFVAGATHSYVARAAGATSPVRTTTVVAPGRGRRP